MQTDTPTNREKTADALGLQGLHREIFLDTALHVGDNQRGTRGQLESIRDFIHFHPDVLFPDTMITLDHYYGDGRGANVELFTSAKNIFSNETGGNSNEWASDLGDAVDEVFGEKAKNGDSYTYVLAHEVCHSLDRYVRTRENGDLERRWFQSVALGTGPDVLPSDDDWIDWDATKAHFQSHGYWDGVEDNWDGDFEEYWESGPGSAWNDRAWMRGDLGWFLDTTQESLATQANQHWSHSEGRIVGAIARWRAAEAENLEMLKANLTEVVTFLDIVSAGMNKVMLYDPSGVQDPYPHTSYAPTRAWLERDERGYITKISVEDRTYEFAVDAKGVITDYATNVF